MSSKEIIVCKDAEDVARRAAERFASDARKAISRDGRFVVALSGGNTPRLMNAFLVQHYANSLDWSRTFLFWGDERAVPPDHEDNNYRMACETLIDHVPIPPSNAIRVRAELPPTEAAELYEKELRAFFRRGKDSERVTDQNNFPVFDLIFLGMGNDGHTASLFPGTPALSEKKRWVVENPVSVLNTERITFTVPLINQAREVIFLVSGTAKAPAVKRV
ncbi:MAG TPA: 6-phosphogluconolactonase, partial [Acidobacteriota bacterium]